LAEFELTNFVLYPNPNKEILLFNLLVNLKLVKIVVHDVLGRKLFDKEYENIIWFNKNIQLVNTASGIYLLTVIDGERKEVKKLVIE
jgi:hypothetical protein